MPSIRAASLMFAALGLLIVPGLLYNNLNNTGLTPNQTLSCPGYPDVTCQGSVLTGCQANVAYCNLSGQTISFLSICSPFTGILSGNLIAFVNSFFSNCGKASLQSAVGLGQGNATLPGLKATYGFHTLSSQRQWSSSNVIHPVPQGISAPYYVSCLYWNGTLAFPNTDGHGTYNTACNFVDSSSPQIGYTMNCWLYGNSTDVNNAICDNWSTSTTGGISFGNILGFGLWLLGAALVLFLSLGISFGGGGSFLASGASFQVGSNKQGSKLAQTVGIGLLVWIPFYSEFSTWFTSGLLPYGIDGVTGIIAIAITATMAFGLYLQATTD